MKEKNIFKKILHITDKDKATSALRDKFIRLRQQKADYASNFLNAKMTAKGSETEITSLMEQAKNYFNDFAKNRLKGACENGKVKEPGIVKNIVDKFRNLRTGQRFVTAIAMTSLMMVALSLVPKLYARNKTNPEECHDGGCKK